MAIRRGSWRQPAIPVARLGPSPGFDDLNWLKPVYKDDTVTYSATVTGKRALRSRPEWGLVAFCSEGVNQNGETVFRLNGHTLVEREPQAAASVE